MIFNRYSVVRKRSEDIFDKYIKRDNKPIDDSKKAQLGFYLLFLKYNHNILTDECKEIIIDTDFCRYTEDKHNVDLGVDAVYIDEDDQKIFLYIFKYRTAYKENTQQEENSYIIATKFFNELKYQMQQDVFNRAHLKSAEKTLDILERLVELLKTNKPYDMYLCQVSNEENPSKEINNMIDQNFLDGVVQLTHYTLNDIMDLFFEPKKNINSKFDIREANVFSYSNDEITTTKHYIMSLPLSNLVRITCDNEAGRNKVDLNLLDLDCKLNLNILYDNVRGYILKSSYNKEMLRTLEDNSSDFFIYNNGITIVVDDLEVSRNSMTKFLSFQLSGMQIVNGGQTLRTIYKFMELNKEKNLEKLDNSSILLKIVKASDVQRSNVARYTNSQNPVTPYDLRSMDSLQIEIEEYLKGCDINYIRKNGDTGGYNYSREISMIYLGQMIYSTMGNPNKASAQKSQIFKKYYEDVFNQEDICELSHKLTDIMYETKANYKKSSYKFSDQKLFYIVYANNFLESKIKLEDIISLLETTISSFQTQKSLSESRKILLSEFKKEFDKELEKLKK